MVIPSSQLQKISSYEEITLPNLPFGPLKRINVEATRRHTFKTNKLSFTVAKAFELLILSEVENNSKVAASQVAVSRNVQNARWISGKLEKTHRTNGLRGILKSTARI